MPSLTVVSLDFISSKIGFQKGIKRNNYRAILNEYYFSIVIKNQMEDFWFQQFAVNKTIELLREQFGDLEPDDFVL